LGFRLRPRPGRTYAVPSESAGRARFSIVALYQETLRHFAERFAIQGASVADAQRRATGFIGQTIANQSSPIAYIDVFWCADVAAGGHGRCQACALMLHLEEMSS
jgi:hypothetical protein